MCAVFVGDVQWLLGALVKDVGVKDIEMRCLSGEELDFEDRVSSSVAVVMVTDQVPHTVRRRVIDTASVRSVPVFMRHSSGAAGMGSCLRRMVSSR